MAIWDGDTVDDECVTSRSLGCLFDVCTFQNSFCRSKGHMNEYELLDAIDCPV